MTAERPYPNERSHNEDSRGQSHLWRCNPIYVTHALLEQADAARADADARVQLLEEALRDPAVGEALELAIEKFRPLRYPLGIRQPYIDAQNRRLALLDAPDAER